jgi:hypothetical protein
MHPESLDDDATLGSDPRPDQAVRARPQVVALGGGQDGARLDVGQVSLEVPPR